MPEQKHVTLKINDREVVVPPGTLVIEVARKLGIEVPSFCYYPGLSLQAACRMCLVEVEKAPKLQTACTLVALDGMVVRTDTEQVHQARKAMLEFLLTNHPLDCPVCDKGGECELQDMVFRYGADSSRFVEEKIHRPEEKWSELVYYDAPRCILCFRCVRVCDEGMNVKALGVGQRGVSSVIIPNREDHLDCEECGMCIDICPVGALTSGTYRYRTRPWEMKYVATVCAHCSNGCKTTLSVRNNQLLRANNRDLSGINKEFLCVKGRFGFDFAQNAARIRQPLLRRNGTLEPTSWDEALSELANRLAAVREKHGAQAIGFIGSNRTTNEENYLLSRLARSAMGTNHVDHHRTADYAGLMEALGPEAPRALATMQQLGEANAILLIANDPSEQNPLVAWQIRSAVRQHGARLYVIHTQPIKLCRQAKQFVQIPAGTEHEVIRWLGDGASGLDASLVIELMPLKSALEKEKGVVIVFGSEVRGAALRDLAALGSRLAGTGGGAAVPDQDRSSVGAVQTRFLALGDYSNSRGAADMGLLPGRLPGYCSIADAAAREHFGKLWGAPPPEQPGLDARQMLSAAVTGELKALYVVGTNPVKTFGISAAERLGGLELLVVHEMFLTETARLADIVLPAACAYEKDGTVTNTAGEIQLLHKAADVTGPRTDFDILRLLSHLLARLGIGRPIQDRTPEAVFEEIRANVQGYNVSLAGLLMGGAEASAPVSPLDDRAAYDVPAGAVFSSRDSLFTSGSLGRYCTMIQSLAEAKAKP